MRQYHGELRIATFLLQTATICATQPVARLLRYAASPDPSAPSHTFSLVARKVSVAREDREWGVRVPGDLCRAAAPGATGGGPPGRVLADPGGGRGGEA